MIKTDSDGIIEYSDERKKCFKNFEQKNQNFQKKKIQNFQTKKFQNLQKKIKIVKNNQNYHKKIQNFQKNVGYHIPVLKGWRFFAGFAPQFDPINAYEIPIITC